MSFLMKIYDVPSAQNTILKRPVWDEVEVTPELRAGIERIFGQPLTPDQAVETILRQVRQQGDAALFDYNRRIEGADLSQLRVSEQEMDAAWRNTPAGLRQALQVAADRIRLFHEKQPKLSWIDWDEEGGALGQIVRPLDRVGIYAPGGRAAYPSSLLMAAIPARVAGVPHLVVTSPPRSDGCVCDVILAAAHVAGVEAVYKVGGAQAIAAMAFGSETVPRVDKIVGPGNLFVVLAKRRVFGLVGIDGLPGPTETVIVADETANPAIVAADLLAQAEHDVLASPICLTPSPTLAAQVQAELERQAAGLERRGVVEQACAGQGGIVITQDLAEAVALANEYAPEHLCLLVRDAWSWVGRVCNAGGVFVGEMSGEALGDYAVGPAHIMPTGGTARFGSPCNVWDFVKITSVFAPAATTAARIAPAAVALARAEGLTAHAAAIEMRMAP